MDNMERSLEDLTRRITASEQNHVATEEKFIRVFEKLDEIIQILKVSQSRMPNLMWGVLGSALGGVAVWVALKLVQ
jgi:flagellar capping protein FliD